MCKSFERLHCDGFRGRDYLLNHWHLHVIVDDDKLLRPLTDGVDVKVEPDVSDQSPGVRNRAVDLMRTGVSEKSRTDFMKLNYYCGVVFVVFVQPACEVSRRRIWARRLMASAYAAPRNIMLIGS